jgi:hypothetical protein
MGESAQLSFAPKISGEFLSIWAKFPKSANSSAEQWTKFAILGKNSPEIFEGEPQLRGFARFARKKIYCVLSIGNFMLMTNNHFTLFQLPGNLSKTKKMCSLFPWQHVISYLLKFLLIYFEFVIN